MPKPQVISEGPVSMSEVKKELLMIRERDGELNFRANKTEEYLNQLPLLDAKQTEELAEKLDKLGVTRLKPEFITKLVDVMPTTPEEVKVVLQGYTLTVSKDNAKKIVDTIAEYA